MGREGGGLGFWSEPLEGRRASFLRQGGLGSEQGKGLGGETRVVLWLAVGPRSDGIMVEGGSNPLGPSGCLPFPLRQPDYCTRPNTSAHMPGTLMLSAGCREPCGRERMGNQGSERW